MSFGGAAAYCILLLDRHLEKVIYTAKRQEVSVGRAGQKTEKEDQEVTASGGGCLARFVAL